MPLVRVFAKVDEQWNGKVVRFRYDVPDDGKPQNVSVVSSEVPEGVVADTRQAFSKWRLRPAVVEGKLMRQVGCEYDFVLPTGAQQGAPADAPRPAGSGRG